jgi:Phosphopantetheine attachment site
VVPARFDLAVLRTSPEPVPPLFRGLVRVPAQQAERAHEVTLAERLGGLSAEERDQALLDFVLEQAAAVLGHPDPGGLNGTRAFKELGFDSLIAVEFRNRLNAVTGLRLPATLIFDHPAPAVLARHLRAELAPADQPASPLEDLDRLAATLSVPPADEETRAAVSAKLRALLWAWETPDDDSEDDTDFRATTDEEMFDLIDQELHR